MHQVLATTVRLSSPIGTCITFFLTYILWPSRTSVCDATKQSRWLRRAGLLTNISVAVASCVTSAVSIDSRLNHGDVGVDKTATVCSLLDTLVWVSLMLVFAASGSLSWSSYAVSAAFALLNTLADLVITTLESRMHSETFIALMSLRCFLLLGLFLISVAASRRITVVGTADETEPLLGSPQSTASQSLNQKDDSEDDPDSDDDEDFFIEKRKEVLQARGGLLKYLSSFKVFWPYLWPHRNRRLQSILMIIFVNLIAQRAVNVLYPRQLGIVVDKLYVVATTGGPVPWQEMLIWIGLVLLGSHTCGLISINELLGVRISNWSTVQLQSAAFNHVMGLSMKFHDDKDSGEVIKAIEQAGSLGTLMTLLVLETIPFFFDIAIALWYASTLLDIYASVIILYIAVAFVFVFYFFSIVVRRARRKAAADSRAQSRLLYELVSNWATVAYFGRRPYEQRRLAQSVQTATSANQAEFDLELYMFGTQELLELLGRFAVAVLAAYKISQGDIKIGNFVAVQSYWETITTPLWNLGHTFRQVAADLVDAERLLQLFQEKPELKEGFTELPPTIKGAIDVSDVSFGYSQQLTLRDVGFKVQPGQTVALVGATGAGKSTMTKLLMRFFDVQSGSISIDGVNIKDTTLESLRASYGFVPQSAALFNTSILENVRYGRLNASDEDVYAACRSAAIHDRILSFPKEYHTKVGERGVKLSGGELQRIAIARVILKNPRIVLLDEATSALDTQTEAKIQQALKALTRDRTTVVIAHRLSTIVDADMIFVFDEGRIIERGRHHDLLAQNGKYKDYWTQQTRNAETRTPSNPDRGGGRLVRLSPLTRGLGIQASIHHGRDISCHHVQHISP